MCPHHVSRSNFPVDGVERSINLCRNSSCVNERTSNDTSCTTADAFIGDGEMRFHGAPFPSPPARQTRHRSKQEVQQSMSLTTGSGQQPVSLAVSTGHPHSCCARQVCSQQRAVRSFTMASLPYNTQHVTTHVASKCVWRIRSTFRDSSTAATGRVYSSTCISTALPRWAEEKEEEEEKKKVALAPDVGRALVSAEKLTLARNEVHSSRSRPHIKHASGQVTSLRRTGESSS